MAEKKIEIKLVRSVIGRIPKQRKTVQALGLRRIGSRRIVTETPMITGMLRKVEHLLEVKEL